MLFFYSVGSWIKKKAKATTKCKKNLFVTLIRRKGQLKRIGLIEILNKYLVTFTTTIITTITIPLLLVPCSLLFFLLVSLYSHSHSHFSCPFFNYLTNKRKRLLILYGIRREKDEIVVLISVQTRKKNCILG